MQEAEHPMLALVAELTIIKVVKEEEPIIVDLPMIEVVAVVPPTIAKLLMGKAVREAVGEVVGEATVGTHEMTMTLAVASPEAGHLVGLFSAMTIGNSSQFYSSPSRSSQAHDQLPRRLIDCLI